uniref:Uncharacterized protein n=1 Tax=Megaselia scalaris TaxID=36166 RepID=T1GDG8_MEGSC
MYRKDRLKYVFFGGNICDESTTYKENTAISAMVLLFCIANTNNDKLMLMSTTSPKWIRVLDSHNKRRYVAFSLRKKGIENNLWFPAR